MMSRPGMGRGRGQGMSEMMQSSRPVAKKDYVNNTRTQYQTWLNTEENVQKKNDWEGTQEKAFTRWVNSRLKERDMELTNLIADLANGVYLHALCEICSGKKIQN
jgi:hypothetical protein